jgi:glycosyltransferase involved in cell wall biosynthesis
VKKVLVVSYYYPPIGGVGIVRTLKFTKYLPESGWFPHVLTVKNRDRFYTSLGYDDIPEQVAVHRSWNILNNLSILEGGLRRLKITSQVIVPDAYCGWIPLAVRDGIRIIKTEGIDLIYVSCPPFSAALIGSELKKRTGLPLVVDFRDAWTLNPYAGRYLVPFLKKQDEKFERTVFETADFIITATDGIKEDYIQKYPSVRSRIEHIPNGFDTEDIPKDVELFEKFTIAYTGFFYGTRTPETLFQALERIFRSGQIPPGNIRFLWAGPDAPFVFDLAEKYNVRKIVEYVGLIPKKKADELIYQSQLLYFVIGGTEDNKDNTTLTGKIFPYLASEKPILAEIPAGAAGEMIRKYSDNSYIVSPGDSEGLTDAIIREYTAWNTGKKVSAVSEKTEQFRAEYSFRKLSNRIGNVFDKVYQYA